MQKIVALIFAGSLLCSASTWAQTTSRGNCSPNASVIISSQFICIDGLTSEDRSKIEEMRRAIEATAAIDSKLNKEVASRLAAISKYSGNRYLELRKLYFQLDRSITSNTQAIQLLRERMEE